MRTFMLPAVASVCLFTSCVEGVDHSGPCTPGASVECACTNGSKGAQVCKDDQTYQDCVCQSSTGDGSSVSAQGFALGKWDLVMYGGGRQTVEMHENTATYTWIVSDEGTTHEVEGGICRIDKNRVEASLTIQDGVGTGRYEATKEVSGPASCAKSEHFESPITFTKIDGTGKSFADLSGTWEFATRTQDEREFVFTIIFAKDAFIGRSKGEPVFSGIFSKNHESFSGNVSAGQIAGIKY